MGQNAEIMLGFQIYQILFSKTSNNTYQKFSLEFKKLYVYKNFLRNLFVVDINYGVRTGGSKFQKLAKLNDW